MSIFGPKNTKVYIVDLFTGEIDSYMTSKDEAECDACNGDCFLSKKEADTFSKKIKKEMKKSKIKFSDIETSTLRGL